MNLFAVSGLFIGITSAILLLILFFYGRTKLHRIWALFNLAVAVWGVGTYIAGKADDPQTALLGWQIGLSGGVLIATFFYHTIYEFCELKQRGILFFAYFFGLGTDVLFLFKKVIPLDKWKYFFDSIYYYEGTVVYKCIMIIWVLLVTFSYYELLKYLTKSKGVKRSKSLYLCIGALFGFIGGTSAHLPSIGILIYPAGNFGVAIYSIIATYAILRYQLLDIRIAISRLAIFAIVYTLVLGVPFYIYFALNRPLMALVFMGILATAGPFIYLFFQKKAESRLLQEERRTQELLLQASIGMNTIHHLDRLVELIVEVVMKILRVEKAFIYLLDREGGEYKPASKNNTDNSSVIKSDHPLITALKNTRTPVVSEEIKMQAQSDSRSDHAMITSTMNEIFSSVAIPLLIDGTLLGFLALGDRKSREFYSKDLLSVLMVLGNQAALAIENCYYLQAEAKRMDEEGARERMMSLDHMASSMAHEIDNPLHALKQSLGYITDFLLRDPRVAMPKEVKCDFEQSIERSLQSAQRVSDMIKAILDYSKTGTGEFGPVRISDAVEGFRQLIQPQVKAEKVHFTIDEEENLPMVLGDRIQMEEIFMNFVNNALHAVRGNENGKTISLKIFAKDKEFIRIECADNGYGIPSHLIKDIFLSSVTTKGSTEGTGLGLFRVRKIVDLFRGRVWAESQGKGKGATMIVELPVYDGVVRS